MSAWKKKSLEEQCPNRKVGDANTILNVDTGRHLRLCWPSTQHCGGIPAKRSPLTSQQMVLQRHSQRQGITAEHRLLSRGSWNVVCAISLAR